MRNRNKEMSKAGASYAMEADIAPIRKNVIPVRPVEDHKAGSMPIDSRRGATAQKATLTHDRVAERAKALWLASGCVPGRDEQNWREAEAQLRAELKSE